jgi:hypothetical protein
MYEVPLTSPHADFFKGKPSVWYRLFMIGMHCVNVSIVYMLWGWCPALLFAVHPLCVWGVAWVTGNYYATAAYFTLIAYFIITKMPNVWGALIAMPIYAAGLNSTVCPMTFPFLFLFIGQPWGLTMFFPLFQFMKGKRFQTGIKIRYNINNDKVIRDKSVKVNLLRRPAVMTRVVARYIYPCFFPDRLGFFDGFGRKLKENPIVYNAFHSYDLNFFVCFALCLSVFIGGLLIHPVGILWFFCFLMLHSQFNLTGQFYAQRYLYLALVGFCVVVGTAIQPYPILVACIVTFLIIRTHLYIPAWKNQEAVWRNDVETFNYFSQTSNNLAQFYLQVDDKEFTAWKFNEIAALLFKAENQEPNSWEIQMNIACLFAKMGNYEECLVRSKRCLALVKPLGGVSMPVDVLNEQIKNLEEHLQKQKESANVADPNNGRAITSLPELQEGVNHGTRTEERVLEPC